MLERSAEAQVVGSGASVTYIKRKVEGCRERPRNDRNAIPVGIDTVEK